MRVEKSSEAGAPCSEPAKRHEKALVLTVRHTRNMNLLALLALLFQTPHQQHHPPQDAAEYARILNDPAREAWQKPHEVVMALNLKPGDAIADIGAGSGYF